MKLFLLRNNRFLSGAFGLSLLFTPSALGADRTAEETKAHSVLADAAAAERSGKLDRAISLYKDASALEATKEQGAVGFARVYFQREEYKQAEKELARFVKQNPFVFEPRLWLAKTYQQLKKFDVAMKEIRHAEELRAGSSQAKAIKGSIHFDKGEFGEAIDLLSQTLKDDPQSYDSRLIRAKAYMARKQWDLAIGDSRGLVEQRPQLLEGRLMMGTAQLEKTALKEAEDTLRSALKYHPENEDLNVTLGDLSEKQNKAPQAMEFFKKVLEINPKNVDAGLKLARLHLKANQQDLAEQILRTQLGFYPRSRAVNYELVKLLLDKKRPDLAGKELDRFTDRFPHEVWALITYERMLISIGAYDRAEDVAKRSMAATKYAIEPFLYFGYIRHKKGDFRSASKIMKDAESKYLKDNRVKFNLGLAYEMDGEVDEAIAKYKEVQDDSDVAYKAKINLALLLERLGKKDEATRTLRSVVLPKDRKLAQTGAEGSELSGFKPFREMELP